MKILGEGIFISYVGGVFQAIRRFFSTLDGLSTSYTMPTWAAAGDFAVPFKFALVGAPANETILGETASAANSLKVTNATTITAVVNSVSIPFTVPAVGTLYHSGVLSRVGTVLSLDLDATTYNNATASTGLFTLTKLGVSNGTDFGSMTLADVGFTDTAGGDNRFYPIDGEQFGAGAIEVNALNPGTKDLQKVNFFAEDVEQMTKVGADWLGGDRILSPPAAFGTDVNNTVTGLSTNGFTLRGDGSVFFGVEYNGVAVIGQTFRVSGFATVVSGAAKIQSAVADSLYGSIQASGPFSFVAASDGTQLRFARKTGGQAIDIAFSNVKLERVLETVP